MPTDYEIIAAEKLRNNSRDSEAWCEWGLAIAFEATSLPSTERQSKFEEAAKKIGVAATLAPRSAKYWQNWGAVMLEVAKGSTRSQAPLFFQRACDYLYQAVRIAPSAYTPWVVYADCYIAWAELVPDSHCSWYFEQAFKRYGVAAELISPDEPRAWLSWAIALVSYARRVEYSLTPRLLIEALQKYDKLVTLEPGNSLFYREVATVSMSLVKMFPDFSANHPWVDRADVSLRKAIALDSDNAYSWATLGDLLYLRGSRASCEEQTRFWEEADRAYERADLLKPDKSDVIYNWACLQTSRSLVANDRQTACNLQLDGEAKYVRAIQIEPNIAIYWAHWGYLIYYRAAVAETNSEKEHLYQQAILKAETANTLTQNQFDTLILWAFSLSYLARVSKTTDAQRTLLHAEEKAELLKSLNLQQDRVMILLVDLALGNAMISLVLDRREMFLQKAESQLHQAKKLGADIDLINYYAMCIAAVRGVTDITKRLVMYYLQQSNSPNSRWRLYTDLNLISIRDAPWFHDVAPEHN